MVRVVSQSDKNDAMHKLLCEVNTGPDGTALKEQLKVLVFCGTKRYVEEPLSIVSTPSNVHM